MSGIKISALPAANVPLSGNELLEVVQSGVSKQAILNTLAQNGASFLVLANNGYLNNARTVVFGPGMVITDNGPGANILIDSLVGGSPAWTSITGKPTSLLGYGINDAAQSVFVMSNLPVLKTANNVTAEVTVYTAPAATNVITTALVITNTTGGSVTYSVRVYDSSASVYSYLVNGDTLATASSVDPVAASALNLMAGDLVKVTASGAVDVIFCGYRII